MKIRTTHEFLFDDGPDAGLADLPRYALDRVVARVRRRNPPFTPWWHRYVDTWQSFEPPPGPSHEATAVPLIYGLSQAWNEDDVIYATVRNLFIEGIDRVFVIDDASDDDTASEAATAGATVIADASDGKFHEIRRTERIAQVIDEQTAAAGRPVWWVVVDADEFPRGPRGTTVRDHVLTLPPWVDTVGSRVLEHYPAELSTPKSRHHPVDELPNARWHDNPSCPAGHWKHQMLLLRRPGELRFLPGRHAIAAPPDRRPVRESRSSLLMHHVPLRDRQRTEQKIRSAASDSGRYGSSSDTFVKRRLESRLRMLDLAYQDQYHRLPNMFPGEPKTGTSVRDWRDLVIPSERELHHEVGVPL